MSQAPKQAETTTTPSFDPALVMATMQQLLQEMAALKKENEGMKTEITELKAENKSLNTQLEKTLEGLKDHDKHVKDFIPDILKEDDAEAFRRACKRGAIKPEQLPLLLIEMIKIGRVKITKIILDSGTDPNTRTEEDLPVLALAARKDKLEAVKVLLEHKANINEQGPKGNAFEYAVMSGNDSIALYLLAQGSELKPAYLIEAVKMGMLNTVKALLAKNPAKEVALDDEGVSKPKEAKGNAELLIDPNIKDGEGNPALHLAAKDGNVEMVKALVVEGADCCSYDKAGDTAFMCAVKAGNSEVVAYFLGIGADKNEKGNKGKGGYALIWAVGNQHLGVVKALLIAGADPEVRRDNARGGYDYTAIQLATAFGNREIVSALIEYGNAQWDTSCTHIQGGRYDTTSHISSYPHPKVKVAERFVLYSRYHASMINKSFEGARGKAVLELKGQKEKINDLRKKMISGVGVKDGLAQLEFPAENSDINSLSTFSALCAFAKMGKEHIAKDVYDCQHFVADYAHILNVKTMALLDQAIFEQFKLIFDAILATRGSASLPEAKKDSHAINKKLKQMQKQLNDWQKSSWNPLSSRSSQKHLFIPALIEKFGGEKVSGEGACLCIKVFLELLRDELHEDVTQYLNESLLELSILAFPSKTNFFKIPTLFATATTTPSSSGVTGDSSKGAKSKGEDNAETGELPLTVSPASSGIN